MVSDERTSVVKSNADEDGAPDGAIEQNDARRPDAVPMDVQQTRFGQMCRNSQNLSAVLNDPRKARLDVQNFFVRYWGDQFTENAEIPPLDQLRRVVTWNAFQQYVDNIPPRFQRHERDNKQVPCSNFTYSRFGVGSVHNLPTTTDVPSVFFNDSFSLTTQESFNALSRLGESDLNVAIPVWQSSSRLSRFQRANKALQEQLGVYLDKIELEIAGHLSTKSQAFFQLMSFHDELQKQIRDASVAVRTLRVQMASAKQSLTTNWLRLIAMRVRRCRIVQLLQKMDLIATVVQTQDTVRSLLNSADFMAALELVSTTKAVLNEELKGMHSFRNMYKEFSEIESSIGGLLLDEFLRFFRAEFDSQAVVNDLDQFHLQSLVTGLLRHGQLEFCQRLKDEAMLLIKLHVRQTAREKIQCRLGLTVEQPVAEIMRQCSSDSWFAIFVGIAEAVLCFCKKVESLLAIVRRLVLIASGDQSEQGTEWKRSLSSSILQMLQEVKLSSFDADTLCDSVANLFPAVCTFAEERLCRVVVARGKDDFFRSLTVDQFVHFVSLMEDIDGRFQQLTGRRPANSPLRIQLRSSMDGFIRHFHKERKTKLTNIIDSENWQRAEVPRVFQDIVDQYGVSGVLRDVSTDAHPVQCSRVSSGGGGSYRFYLSVGGEKFVVIGTALMMLQIVAQYCQLVESLPGSAFTILSLLVELLKMYNSRSCQLILGAGALQMVGLKTISSVHLALSCRSLQLVTRFIGVIESSFRRQLDDEQMDRRLQQLTKDYEDHVAELLAKIASVLESRLDASMQQWSPRGSPPSSSFSRLAKHIKRLYDSNHDILTADDLRRLMIHFCTSLRAAVLLALQNQQVDAQHKPDEYRCASNDYAWLLAYVQRLPCCADGTFPLPPTLC